MKDWALAQTTGLPIPAFGDVPSNLDLLHLRDIVGQAVIAWLKKTPSHRRTDAYARDLDQFMDFLGIEPDHWELLLHVRPEHVQQWRDALIKIGRKPRTVIRKITTLRGLYSYLRNYGYVRANPAHPDFVEVPPEPRDGATVAMTAQEVRARGITNS